MAEESKAKKKNEVAIFDVKKFSIAQLPELQNKKEEIAAIIEANPIVEIVDTETYEQAKKSRTAVKTLRTGTEKEQAEVKKNVKILVLEAIDKEYNSIVTDIKSEEKKRQDIVTAYEDKKQAEKDEKERKEIERIQTIKDTIDNYAAEWKTAFNLMVFDTIQEVGASFLESYTEFDLTLLKEFETLFPTKIQELTEYLSEKTISLTDAEKSRSTKAIGEWYVAWGGTLFSMCIENADGIVELFDEQEKLTFPIQEFQDDFDEKFKEIEKQIKAKQTSLKNEKKLADEAAIEQQKKDLELARKTELIESGFSFDGNNYFVSDFKRLDMGTILSLSDEAFSSIIKAGKTELKRLSDLAEEEKEAIYEIRKNRLLEIGLKYSDEHDTIFVHADSDFILLADDVLNQSTLEFENTIAEAKDAYNEFHTVPEEQVLTPETSPEPAKSTYQLKGEESEEKALKVVQDIDNTNTDEPVKEIDESISNDLPVDIFPGIRTGKIFTGNTESAGTTKTIVSNELPTWDDIIEEFKTSGEKSYSAWLKNNFNVPTKIQ